MSLGESGALKVMVVYTIVLAAVQYLTSLVINKIENPDKSLGRVMNKSLWTAAFVIFMAIVTILTYVFGRGALLVLDPTGITEMIFSLVGAHSHWFVAYGWGLHAPLMLIPVIGMIIGMPFQIIPAMPVLSWLGHLISCKTI